jgi:hypothetical protein
LLRAVATRGGTAAPPFRSVVVSVIEPLQFLVDVEVVPFAHVLRAVAREVVVARCGRRVLRFSRVQLRLGVGLRRALRLRLRLLLRLQRLRLILMARAPCLLAERGGGRFGRRDRALEPFELTFDRSYVLDDPRALGRLRVALP